MASVIDYMRDRTKASIDPQELRAEVLGEHLPYTQRLRKGVTLTKFFPEFKSEVCRVFVEISSEPDLDPSDKVALLGAMADVGLDPQGAKDELLRMAKTPQRGLVSFRSDACTELHRLKEKEMAVEGYMSIIMDADILMTSRALMAQVMAGKDPGQKDATLSFLWSAGKDKKLDALARIEILRRICEVDPSAIDQATALIREIKMDRRSNT